MKNTDINKVENKERNQKLSKAKQSKAVPLQAMQAMRAWRYSSSFLTSALGGVEWSASRLGRDLPPENDPPYPLYWRLGWPRSRSRHRG
jgi:hypothetical protein